MSDSTIAVQPRPELMGARKGLLERRLRDALKAPVKSASIPRRPDAGSAPLSFAQHRLWFIDQLEPGSPAYHVATFLRLAGPLDIQALERSLQNIVERHEILHTRFPSLEGAPLQLIEAAPVLDLPLVDLVRVPDGERESQAQKRLKQAAQEPFNLASGPLIRALLLRLGPAEHLLLVVMHHIVSDGWSLGVLFRELELSYSAITQQKPAELPELQIQYADYAHWQQQTLEPQSLDDHLEWWKQKLDKAPASLNLPTDTDRTEQVSVLRGADSSIRIAEPLFKQITTTSHAHSATPFMMLLSAFVITLHRWSKQADVVVGTVVAGRTSREVENLIG